MLAKIQVRGVEASILDGEWSCDDPDILGLCERAAATWVYGLNYYPDVDRQIARHVAIALDGEVTEVNDPPFDPKAIY